MNQQQIDFPDVPVLKLSQKQVIMLALLDGWHIPPLVAWQQFGIYRLADVVHKIRKDNWWSHTLTKIGACPDIQSTDITQQSMHRFRTHTYGTTRDVEVSGLSRFAVYSMTIPLNPKRVHQQNAINHMASIVFQDAERANDVVTALVAIRKRLHGCGCEQSQPYNEPLYYGEQA